MNRILKRIRSAKSCPSETPDHAKKMEELHLAFEQNRARSETIDVACKWLETHMEAHNCRVVSDKYETCKDFLERFRNAVEGEVLDKRLSKKCQ